MEFKLLDGIFVKKCRLFISSKYNVLELPKFASMFGHE